MKKTIIKNINKEEVKEMAILMAIIYANAVSIKRKIKATEDNK
jgi:hypothetical protein